MSEPIRTSNTKAIPEGAKNGISLPFLRVDGIDYDLSEMARHQLVDLKVLLQADIANIDLQMESNHTGSWARPGWEASAKYARRMKSSQVELIQAELGRRKELIPSLHQFFVDKAREILESDLFESIMEAAKTRRREAMGLAGA